jgi:hypothetical protein
MRTHVLLLLCCVAASWAAVTEVSDSDIQEGSSVVWETGDTLLLTERVYVESGAVLTIEPGVVVKGKYYSAPESEEGEFVEWPKIAALIISRGGKIIARGTAEEPIIMTTERDDLIGDYDKSALSPRYLGMWGGLVICGNAPVSIPNADEGQLAFLSSSDNRAAYGGTDPEDSSGVLEYVSVRYAGTNEFTVDGGEDPDWHHDACEFAGITFAGVGSKTHIGFVDAYNCKDDAIRFLGGTARAKYLSAGFCGDNSFDFDQGYAGELQYLFALQIGYNRNLLKVDGEAIAYHGGRDPGDKQVTAPAILNAGYFADAKLAPFMLDIAGGGRYANSFFYNVLPGRLHHYSWPLLQTGEVKLSNNLFGKFVDSKFNLNWDFFTTDDTLKLHLIRNYNSVLKKRDATQMPDSMQFRVASFAERIEGYLDFHHADEEMTDPDELWPGDSIESEFFDKQACFKGPFDPTAARSWIRGWTGIDFYGYLSREDKAYMDGLPCQQSRVASRVFDTRTAASVSIASKSGALQLRVALPRPVGYSVTLYSAAGKKLYDSGVLQGVAGLNQHDVSAVSLAAGVYVCRVAAPGLRVQRSISVMQ